MSSWKNTDKTWADITREALKEVTSISREWQFSVEDVANWIDKSSYLTDAGRAFTNWANGRLPVFRSSVHSTLREMKKSGELNNLSRGLYRWQQVGEGSNKRIKNTDLWQSVIEKESKLKPLIVRHQYRKDVSRQLKSLSEALFAYYDWRCMICDSDGSGIPLIPTKNGKYYVEIHHLDGLAENFSEETDCRHLNEVGNLIVICAHHHTVIHRHHPKLIFDRSELAWKIRGKKIMEIRSSVPEEHKIRIRERDR
jgi:hypothetical protein